MNSKYRAQILLEPEQHAALAEIAQRQNRSISDVMREIVRQYLDQQAEDHRWAQRMEAINRLDEIRVHIAEQYGVYQGDLVNEARAEQNSDSERIWRGEA